MKMKGTMVGLGIGVLFFILSLFLAQAVPAVLSSSIPPNSKDLVEIFFIATGVLAIFVGAVEL